MPLMINCLNAIDVINVIPVVITLLCHKRYTHFQNFAGEKCCSSEGSPCINALKFSPNGSMLAASIGHDVVVFSAHRTELKERGRYHHLT